MTFAAIPVARGCGTREEGGLYWELGVGPGGLDPADFLLDPPQLLPPDLHIPAIGMVPVVGQTEGVYTVHLLDRVGLQHYPNVPDFAEEMARYGASRKIPKPLLQRKIKLPDGKTAEVAELLNAKSRLLLIHDRASFARPLVMPSSWRCFNGRTDHLPEAYKAGDWKKFNDELRAFNVRTIEGAMPPPPACLGATWFDLIDGEEVALDQRPRHIPNLLRPSAGSFVSPEDGGLVRRIMPSFSYYGVAHTPTKESKALARPYVRAFFAALPCSRLAIVKGPNDEATLRQALRSALMAQIVDE